MVTWSKDGQVISADSFKVKIIITIIIIIIIIEFIFFKVLQDARISVRGELGGQGVSLTISGLRRSDAGQ